VAHLRRHGDVHEDAVRVGVFLKSNRKFAEVRPMARALSVSMVLPQLTHDARIVRHERLSDGRHRHVLRLHSADEVDDQLCAWLTDALAAADE
jgi:hypothetical protein